VLFPQGPCTYEYRLLLERRPAGQNLPPAQLANTTATTQSALRTAIWQERRVELAMEGDRFVDLVRTGQAATVLASYGFTAGKNELFPIPLNAINQSKGVLTQNPGY
jgi:hypothetical protein